MKYARLALVVIFLCLACRPSSARAEIISLVCQGQLVQRSGISPLTRGIIVDTDQGTVTEGSSAAQRATITNDKVEWHCSYIYNPGTCDVDRRTGVAHLVPYANWLCSRAHGF